MKHVLSVGGSLVIPDDKVNTSFLKKLKELIKELTKKGHCFALTVGGGSTCRKYQRAAKKLRVKKEDLDWIGIASTKLNAELVRSVLKNLAKEKIYDDPVKAGKNFGKKVVVCSGSVPGGSTDMDAVILARAASVKEVINLTNIDYVYDKNPKLRGAKPLKELTWKEMKKIIGGKWVPGMNAPFDPIASKYAEKHGITVKILKGDNFKNLSKCLNNKKFRGTTIKG